MISKTRGTTREDGRYRPMTWSRIPQRAIDAGVVIAALRTARPNAPLADARALMEIIDELAEFLPKPSRRRTQDITRIVLEALECKDPKREDTVYPRDIWGDAISRTVADLSSGEQIAMLSPPKRGPKLRAYIDAEIRDAMMEACEGKWPHNTFFITALKRYLEKAGIQVDFT